MNKFLIIMSMMLTLLSNAVNCADQEMDPAAQYHGVRVITCWERMWDSLTNNRREPDAVPDYDLEIQHDDQEPLDDGFVPEPVEHIPVVSMRERCRRNLGVYVQRAAALAASGAVIAAFVVLANSWGR